MWGQSASWRWTWGTAGWRTESRRCCTPWSTRCRRSGTTVRSEFHRRHETPDVVASGSSTSQTTSHALNSSVHLLYYAPPLIGGALSDAFVWRLSVCLSVAYIGPTSRTERPRKTKLGTGIAHVTRDSDATFKVKRSKVKVTRPLYSARP